jgi:hypothetical protein
MLVIFIYYIKVIVEGFLKIFINLTNGYYGTQRYYDILTKNLFFRDIIGISIETYLEFCLNIYLNFYKPLDTSIGEKLSLIMAFYLAITSIMILSVLLGGVIGFNK